MLIDTDDLDMLIKMNSSWNATWSYHTNSYYVVSTEYIGYTEGKSNNKTNCLQRVIMHAKGKEVVDHKNHDGLDNRKDNLRITSNENNTKHKNGKNKNNTSGYRNVSKIGKKWCVQMQVDGKNTCLKKFDLDKLEEAGAYAEEMRNFYYGEFQGVS